jgi:two-component response regulator ARR-B family
MHLFCFQKFRLYLKKLASGTSSRHGLFTDDVVFNEGNSINITRQGHFEHNLENGRYYHPSISFAGFSSSSNPFGRLNSSAAFGTHNLLPTQSVELMTQRSLGITTLKNMGPVGYGGNMSRVAVPGSQQDLRNFISCGISNTSMCFPSGPSGSSFANVSNGMPSNSFANIPNASSPLAASMERLLYPFKSYARQCMADGEELPPPSSNLPMKQPIELAAPFNGLSGFPKSGKTVAISKFLDLGSEGKTTEVGSFEGNSLMINRLSRFASSSSSQTSEFQNQMTALTKKTTMPMAHFNEQVAPFNIGSSTNSTMIKNHRSTPGGASSTVSTFPNLQMNKPVMLSEMLNGEGVIVDQQAFGDELNNNIGFLAAASTAHNGTNDSFDDFFGGWLNQVRSFILCFFAYALTICFVIFDSFITYSYNFFTDSKR